MHSIKGVRYEGGGCEGHPSHAPSVRILNFKLTEKATWTLSTSILFGFNTYNPGPEMHGKHLYKCAGAELGH
jgi:hypothetical protein